VNGEHLRAFLWLRWRIRFNQLRRGGALSAALSVIVMIFLAFIATGAFVTFLFVGALALKNASPAVLMYVWDGLIFAFLFAWAVGLITELQRSEVLSLDKFLHLPVSLSGAFLINYLSTLASVTLALFLPGMVGLCLGLVYAKGPAMLLLLPLLLAFILLVTALTYQFQGWLASLMVNKRRRRTIVVTMTILLVLVGQAGNLVNIFIPKQARHKNTVSTPSDPTREWQREMENGKLTQEEYRKRLAEHERQKEIAKSLEEEADRKLEQTLETTASLINLVVPFGWLPLGARALAQGGFFSDLLATGGLVLLGSLSLRRSYRTTLRLYTGQFTAGKIIATPAATQAPAPVVAGKPSRFLEKKLPLISEQASAITLSCFRSLMRAPEAKLVLIGPFIMVLVFAGLARQSDGIPEFVRPFFPLGGMMVTLLAMISLVGNQFGFDRSGFRVFVLCPASRQDILLGKNLAVAPMALTLGFVAAAIIQICFPVRFDFFLALLPQMTIMYLLFCMLANCLSILAPMPISSGSLKPVQPKLIPVLLNIVSVFLLPLVFVPALLPILGQFIVENTLGIKLLPTSLILSLIELPLIAGLYWLVLNLQGLWLQAREKKILEVVTSKAE
jgi:hypothetical protein